MVIILPRSLHYPCCRAAPVMFSLFTRTAAAPVGRLIVCQSFARHPFLSSPNKITLYILCYLLTWVSGCAQTNVKSYFPLADGVRWEYTGYISPSAGGKQIIFHATAKVDGETLINGQRYFKHITSSDLSGSPESGKGREYVRYYRVAEDGIYFRLGSDPGRPELLEIPLPIPIGTKWLSGETEVQAEHAGTITIRAREYPNCLKITYRQQGVAHSLENYLAPDVGVIKAIDVNATEPKSTIELILEKYEP